MFVIVCIVVTDRTKFCERFLYNKEVGSIGNAEELGNVVHEVLKNLHMEIPVVYDGAGYNSIFKALRFDLFGFSSKDWKTKDYQNHKYYLVGVYEVMRKYSRL